MRRLLANKICRRPAAPASRRSQACRARSTRTAAHPRARGRATRVPHRSARRQDRPASTGPSARADASLRPGRSSRSSSVEAAAPSGDLSSSSVTGTRGDARRISQTRPNEVDDSYPQPVVETIFRACRACARGDSPAPRPLRSLRDWNSAGMKRCMWLKRGMSRNTRAVEHLDPAAGIGRAVPEQSAAHAVCDPRGHAPQPRVAARRAIAHDEPESIRWRGAQRREQRGRSAGSFWPSPSSVAISGARAARTPVATAALCPDRTT